MLGMLFKFTGSHVPSPDHADVRVRLGEGPGAGGGRAVAAGVTGVPANIN